MEFDDLKQQWQAHDRSLETLLRLRRPAIRNNLNRTYRKLRWSSRWAVFWAVAELGVGVAVLLSLGSFIADHIGELHLAVPAIGLHLFVIACLVILGRQLYWIHAIDYQRPILEIQQRLERLRIERLRALQLVWLLAPLLWIPMLIVGIEALTGIDVSGALPRIWLWVNLLLGLAWIPFAWWGSRLLARRCQGSPLAQRTARGIAGADLIAAREFLQELERFEAPEPA